MALPLILLLFGAYAGVPPRTASTPSARTEGASAVEVSAALRFGWVYATVHPDVVAPAPLPQAAYSAPHGRALPLWPAFRAESALAPPGMKQAREVALAAQWIDALPLKVDARDGGLLVALRVRGP